ncbi:uncharacterized protein BX663DRAFT_512192 [Cokeromyces recurvatus]|uniref:uncharacterized protein n=1 Tax=Cokeromyces recurvatus TaxID=90255 RepID=UPI0022206DFD|nr:uncharacterized protein BX663DRAFT_512192 [Cokeromyces recurvatus]KAI7902227.1 hypothetical protein BX663DRAFT_512192 [Cokeromyces recurvatus]
MSSIYVPFEDQKKQDASITLRAMGIQLGINVGTALAVMIGFSLLRPRNSLVYAPKLKFSAKGSQPPSINSNEWFAWVKPILRIPDDQLLKLIGCDALLFIRFTRLLRKLFFFMTLIGVCALIPINIVATKLTGQWPPPSGSIDILSIAGINLHNGKLRTDPNTAWYWSPFAATWLFSIMIAYFMYKASCDYIKMRQYYFRLPENEITMKSLIVSRIPETMRSDDKLKTWIESTKAIKYPIKDTMIGYHSSKLTELFEKHEIAVQNLETTLASYLNDGKDSNLKNKKRPTVRIGSRFFCFGGQKVDAIDYYTKEVSELEKEINDLRKSQKAKTAHYGWVSFDRIEWAHATEQSLKKELNIRLSPTPSNLVWSNLPLDEKTRKTKRWIGHAVYWVFVFAWMIPMGTLSATSNIINLIRLIPNSAAFIEHHQILMGIIQSYFTPIIMAFFFYLLPIIFRFLSKHQGYWTQTSLDRKVLTKLYIFFIINNLLVFTLTSMFIGIYGQLRSLVESGTLPGGHQGISLTGYVMQVAKNIADVSTFWINFVCLKSLGLTMDLAMVVPLVTITVRKFLTRPSPREIREMARPPFFDYPQNYNLLLFFFTIALVYSAMSPLILPFAFVYFCVAGLVFKYMLMYIYVTKIESGGKIWPVLFQIVMTSVIFFQVTMIIILTLKNGYLQAYILIPLPILTLIFQYVYYRRMHRLGSYLSGTEPIHPVAIDESFMGDQDHLKKEKTKKKKQSLESQFQDPAYHDQLLVPTVHDDVKHLLKEVYHNDKGETYQDTKGDHPHHLFHETIEMAEDVGKRILYDMDLNENKGFYRHSHRMTLYDNNNQHCPIQFDTITENDILLEELSDSHDEVPLSKSFRKVSNEDNKAEENVETLALLARENTEQSSSSNGHYDYDHDSSILYNHTEPLVVAALEPSSFLSPPPLPAHNPPLMKRQLQQRQERNVTSEYIELYSSFTPTASAVELNTNHHDLVPSVIEEKILIEEDDDDVDDLDESTTSDMNTQILYKRYSAPIFKSEDSIEEEVGHAQRYSLPPNHHFQFYQPSLAITVDESQDDGESIQLKRPSSLPDILNHTHKNNSSSLQRSKTMPTQQSQYSQELENPFEDCHCIEKSRNSIS